MKKLSSTFRIGMALFLAVFSSNLLPVATAFAANTSTDPAGNNGTIKIDGADIDNGNGNEPHVGCSFNVDFYGYDAGARTATVTFEAQSPTDDDQLVAPIGAQSVNYTGHGPGNTLDKSEAYTLAFVGAPHEQQGYKVKATVHADGSQGNDTKTKVFWVSGCEPNELDTVTPEVPAIDDQCGTANDTFDLPQATSDITYTKNGNVVTATLSNPSTHEFGSLPQGYILSDDELTATYTVSFTNRLCTVPPCEDITNAPVITSKDQFADSDGSKSKGHYEFVKDGLRIFTDDSSSDAKVAWYKSVDFALSEAGEPSMVVDTNSGTIKPGMQMVVDFNNDGTADGILVGESIYGNDWWLSNSAAPFVKANAPSHTGGFGSDNHGTLNQWLTNFPHAQVKAVGFSLGSGVQGDYTIRSLTFGCVKYTFGRVVITPVVCEAPRNGGVITQNTTGWTTTANAAFVNGGVKMTSSNWNDSFVTYAHSYPISQAPTLAWTVTGQSAVTGAYGIGIILKTSTGAYIHYEPSPYTDAFWTNTPGLLPANAGGQGGPYSGSLQDLLDAVGSDVTIVETSFIFTSQDQNEIVLTDLSLNCTHFTFNKVNTPQDNGNVLGETITKTGGQGQGQVLGTTALPTTLPSTGADAMLNALVTIVAMGVAYVLSYRLILRKLV